jgi:predicted DNA-binding transcriptional regulator AlpA
MNITTQQTATHPAQFYRLPHLKTKLNVSGSSIWAWVKAGKFPKPIKLSENCTAWNAAEVEAWAQSRIASSK